MDTEYCTKCGKLWGVVSGDARITVVFAGTGGEQRILLCLDCRKVFDAMLGKKIPVERQKVRRCGWLQPVGSHQTDPFVLQDEDNP